MADTKNVKLGADNSDTIMYDNYYAPVANQKVFFMSLVPKDNINVWHSVLGEWQVNDEWEVEILSAKKIAIKKFRIDTWGLRKIFNRGGTNDTDPATRTDFLSFKVKVSGLDYVHNNVVYQEDDSGNKTYGFVKAFAGSNGYNVYWYPGQFTSGNYIQGLGIQSGIGYSANTNEVDDSLQMGKHPWDISGRVAITDGEVKGTWFDVSYNAITIGLYGGYQTAASWHDYTGTAYKVYDISDNPIIIDLDVPDTTGSIDVSSQECWDIHVGDTQVYHKDKTRENCWKKYGIMFPENYTYFPANLTLSDTVYAKWVASNKLLIKKIPSGGITLTKVNNITWGPESYQASYIAFGIRIYNKLDSITAKFERTFTNVTESGDVSHTLNNGDNDIAAYSKKFYISDRSTTAVFTEFKLSFETSADIDCSMLVELVPIFNDGDYVSVNLNSWNMLSNKILPEVTDKITDMTKTLWNSKPTNTDFWDTVKEWFENNNVTNEIITHGLFRNSNIDEITLRLNTWYGDETDNYPNPFMCSNGAFQNSSITKITIESVNGCSFSVGNRLFSKAGKLVDIIFNHQEDKKNWLVGAADFSGMFEQCNGLKTYPANLIKYDENRSHAFEQGIPCSLANYFFDYGGIQIIPMYGDDRYADANTLVMHRSAQQAFNIGSSLEYLGPVIDMILVQPNSSAGNIFRLEGLTDARIKNLNHGNWNFDGVSRNDIYHGNLPSLDAESVAYLFDNLVDLTTYNPEVHVERIDKSFKSWSTSYANSWDTEFWTSRVAVRYFETRDRRNVTIASTNQTFTDMGIVVSGLQDGDVLSFGDTEITTNGTHYITKSNTNWEGFKLSGDTEDTTNVVIVVIENGLDYTNPIVSSANLYCPSTWEDKVTDTMIESANLKGWNIYINNESI